MRINSDARLLSKIPTEDKYELKESFEKLLLCHICSGTGSIDSIKNTPFGRVIQRNKICDECKNTGVNIHKWIDHVTERINDIKENINNIESTIKFVSERYR